MASPRKSTAKSSTSKTASLVASSPIAKAPTSIAGSAPSISASSQPAGSSKPANGQTPAIQMTLNHEQIAQRAFAIWVAKGKPMNQDLQNWTDAENQLRQELARRA